MHEKIEDVLRQHLGPVSAPPELWDRVQRGSPRPSPSRFHVWATAAAMLAVTVTGWALWKASSPMEIHSASANEVRAWVLSNAGLDVPLPAQPSSLVEILGASIDRAGKLIARISYKAGGAEATLSVTKDDSGDAPHRGDSLSSNWTMKGQSYTLAVAAPADLKAACLLCHSSL